MAFVSLNGLDLCLSLIDTGATLSIIDEWLAHKLHLLLLQGPSIQVNGVGHDRSLGFAMLAFSIQGRKNDNLVSLCSSADFHILSNFSPGILLGLDIIRATSMVIDVCLGRSHIQDNSFPIYNTRGKTMSLKNVSRALVVQNTTTILPHSCSFVHVRHNLLHNVQYTIDSSLWTISDSSGPMAVPSAILDHNNPSLWVSNYGSTPVNILSDTQLAEALPLSPDDMAISTGSFGLNEAMTSLAETVKWNSPVPDTTSPDDIATKETGSLANPTSHIPGAEKVDKRKTSHNSWPNLARPRNHRSSFPTSIITPPSTTCKRSLSFDHHWPRIEQAFTSEPSPPPSTSNDARPLNFTDDPLANPPTPAELDTVLVDDVFQVGRNTQGKAHPSVVTVLCNNLDTFSLNGRPGQVSNVTMKLKLSHPDALCPEAPCRVSPDKRQVIDKTLDQLLDWDVIEPSNSSVSYPVLLVKQGTKWWFCVDYRGLNTATIADRYSLPRINDVFQALHGNKFFSGLDTVWGYYQLDVDKEDHWKMAFVCHRGLFQYKQVPLGLKNPPAFFQRFMDHLLGHMSWTEALVYLNDVVVFSSSLKQHAKSLDCLLKAAHKVGLKPHSSSPNAVPTLDTPRLVPFVHKYQRSTKGMWQLVNANGSTTKASDIKINWEAAQDKALASLKAALSSPPTLAYPDFSRPFFLYVDASQQAFAAALHQRLPLSDCSTTTAKSAATTHAEVNDLDLPAMTAQHQKSDSQLNSIINTIEAGQTRAGYKLQDSLLMYVGPQRIVQHLCVPISDLPAVFHNIHDNASHFGFAKTSLQLTSIHHPRLSSSLQAYIDNCPVCLQTKLGDRVGELSNNCTLLADRPFHTLSADLLLGLPECKGLDAALIVVDVFSKLVLMALCSSRITSSQLFNLLADLVLQRGWKSRVIVTDSDKRFVGATGQQFASSIGIELKPLAPYHQQANPVEHHIQTLQLVLRALAVESAKDWVDILPAAKLAINSTPSLITGQAPFNLVYIARPNPPVLPSVSDANMEDRLTMAKARLDLAWQTALKHLKENKTQYDMRHKPLHVLKVGDQVFIQTQDHPIPGAQRHTKLDPSKIGPFPVKQVLSRHCLRLELPSNLYSNDLFDISQLEPAPKEQDLFNCTLDSPVVTDSQGVAHFEVEAIVGQRHFRDYIQYHIKWRGDPRTTWEFKEDLLEDGCAAAIQDWHHKQGSTLKASAHALDTSLSKHPIAFISTMKSPADSKLLSLELEISCLAWAVHHLQHFLEGAIKIMVITDHAPLGAALQACSPSMCQFTPCIEQFRPT
ncbi:uncharacterized protein UDID_18167 [Ustilago sp. UG-2017a]|nr:uncharacterized protein UDID_18167 [Ustilago sp. UG-2017a]